MKRTYSPEEREKALAACAESGPYQASKAEGAPSYATLCRWCKETGIATLHKEKTAAAIAAREAYCAAKRAELKALLISNAVDLAQRMHEEHIDFKSAGPAGPVEVTFPKAPAQACQQYATAIGILLDKYRLESGEVTSRDEHRNINESALDREIAALVEEHERRAQAGASGEADCAQVRLGADGPSEAEDAGGRVDDLANTGG